VKWDGKAFEVVDLPPKDPESRRIRVLLCARKGDRQELWIGRGDSLLRGQPCDWHTLTIPGSSREVYAITQDAAGRIWAGLADGTLLLAEGDELVDRTPVELRRLNCRILSLLGSPDGGLWLGLDGGGLARLEGGRCTVLNTSHGLPHNVVTQLVLDDKGRLWAAGDRGIFRVAVQELDDVIEGRKQTFVCSTYGRSEGTPSLQANSGYYPNTMQAPDGRIWFATRSGIAIADPSVAGSNRTPPTVEIDEMRVDGLRVNVPVDSGKETPRIGPGAANVQFAISAMSFTAPDRVHVQHQLVGVDPGWVSTPQDRTVTYAQLSPGKYTLRVRAANNDGVWSDQDATLTFVVEPHFWETLWFQFIIGISSLTGTAFAAHRFAVRRTLKQADVLRREAMLERERARIARDIHDQLGASLTQISLLSELAQGDSPAGSPHLPRLEKTARDAIGALDEIVWAVNPRHDNLASLLEYIGQQTVDLLRPAGIRCRLDFPDNVPPRHLPADFRHHLFLIVREAVNNAAKYAQASEVRLCAVLTESEIHITIGDDGRGFDNPPRSGTSNGLKNMRARAMALGGACDFVSGSAAGTTVLLRLPWPGVNGHISPEVRL
jgi:signal transduction histidine kinase